MLTIAWPQIIHARAYTHEAQTGKHACKSCPDIKVSHSFSNLQEALDESSSGGGVP